MLLSSRSRTNGVDTNKKVSLPRDIRSVRELELVLLSIQALVLNEKPFFNEPGYELMSGTYPWDNWASAYNRHAFERSCKTMLSVLSSPPKNFESLVIEHFKGRAEFILNACDMYRKGLAKVGLFDGVVMTGKGQYVSSRFTSSMNTLFGDLVTAFSGIGAPIQNVVDRLEEGNRSEKKKNIGLVKKLRNLFVGLMAKKKSKSQVKVVSRGSNRRSKTIVI
ncbi:hypothetical protein RND81_14G094200 [Saponaria officinalis]|uniref:Uncharacterized protein n=1 Tax=Saponaria officinalis TaxID=3572 RepID=A0AAW1GQG8_SAPOF